MFAGGLSLAANGAIAAPCKVSKWGADDQIGAGDYTFYVKNGWLVEKGKVTEPIRDVNIIGNEVHDATRTSSLGTMGIEPWETTHEIPINSDQSNLYKIVVANNTVHHVFNEVFSWVPSKTFITPHLDEGKQL